MVRCYYEWKCLERQIKSKKFLLLPLADSISGLILLVRLRGKKAFQQLTVSHILGQNFIFFEQLQKRTNILIIDFCLSINSAVCFWNQIKHFTSWQRCEFYILGGGSFEISEFLRGSDLLQKSNSQRFPCANRNGKAEKYAVINPSSKCMNKTNKHTKTICE